MDATVTGWDGSQQRTVVVPGDGRTVEVWDSARVVAGEPVGSCVLGVGDVGRHAHRWRLLAQRWAGVPFWGRGSPPVPAIGRSAPPGDEPPPGHGPDGAPSWTPAHRFVAVPGSRGDRAADIALLEWAVTTSGPVHVVLGHGEGGRLVRTSSPLAATTILLDGGLPLGPDRGDVDLARSWDVSSPDAVLVPAERPSRYEVDDVARFLARHPQTSWRRIGGVDHPGIDHDRIVDSAYAAMVLPGIVFRAVQGRRL